MPPRKSAARNASATPARQTRAASSARTTRGTPGPSTTDIANPQLPEVQTQQSFAYGSTKTPLLPKALKARSRMTTAQMAEELDEEIDQAEANLRAHVAEATATSYRHDPAAERAQRARRRSASRETRESSVASKVTEVSRSRTRSTVDTSEIQTPSRLNRIEEHSDEEVSDDLDSSSVKTSAGVSPTPSVPDWTYVREDGHHDTGIFATIRNTLTPGRNRIVDNYTGRQVVVPMEPYRGPSLTERASHRIHTAMIWLGDKFHSILSHCRHILNQIYDHRYDIWRSSAYVTGQLFGVACFMLVVALLVLATLFTAVNAPAAVRHVREKTPSLQDLGETLRIIRSPSSVINISDPVVAEQVKVSMESFNTRLFSIQEDSTNKFNQLSKQQHGMEDMIKAIGDKVENIGNPSQQVQTPERINYFSLGSGAVVDPYLTSPTKKKDFSSIQNFLHAPLRGLARYQSHPPTEALKSWEEQGDCWCSAASPSSFAQLVVILAHPILPEAVVIEHPMSSFLTAPGNTPKVVELWALDDMKIDVDDQRLGKGFTHIATFEYMAPTSPRGYSPVQTFAIPPLMRPATKFALRVISNYGGEVTCLYRVRMHGRPAAPHPSITEDTGSGA